MQSKPSEATDCYSCCWQSKTVISLFGARACGWAQALEWHRPGGGVPAPATGTLAAACGVCMMSNRSPGCLWWCEPLRWQHGLEQETGGGVPGIRDEWAWSLLPARQCWRGVVGAKRIFRRGDVGVREDCMGFVVRTRRGRFGGAAEMFAAPSVRAVCQMFT